MTDDKNTRLLTIGELREAQWVYGPNIDFKSVIVHRGRYAFWQPATTAMAPDGEVYFPETIYLGDFSITPSAMSLLIHELAHVWQIQSGVWLKMTRLFEGGVYDYGELSLERKLQSYTVEQQASIIADWYLTRHRLKTQHGTASPETYETVVRRALPVKR
ncbi:type IV secretion protein Rhs [Sphingomonas sp. PP-CE-1G-424]|uniref:type IV secretion protein Rhs n=1 Tax=Sphingomonas sp. PP-CE-1G-424 TaxID=2135658 RepID=UPI0010548B92|nr:type IV secretion protein Rhs [Sphingomonas sp. PP-CE-1G-424]TCP66398.1 hypothetical protein C8J43_105123 [Sphingomonas sp. PP-CE-1G-424]